MKEETLYPYVKSFLEDDFECFVAFTKKGPKDVGFADIFGVRDIGGQYCGDIEVIAVEVKLWSSNFGKSLGQALGYSLFAHKCYLAVKFSRTNDAFSLEEKEMANRLGVGLIGIRKYYGVWKCKEILSSSQHTPMQTLLLKTLDRLGYNKCSICGSLFGPAKKWTKKQKEATPEKHFYYSYLLKDGKKTRKPLFTTSENNFDRYTMICSECLKRLRLV